jgi:beta-N-acetylhexosaminidase
MIAVQEVILHIFHLKGGMILSMIISLAITGNLMGSHTGVQTVFTAAELQKAGEIMANMSIEEKVGQMFMLDFRMSHGVAVTKMNDEIREAIRTYAPGGIILFEENTVDALQTRQLIGEFQWSSPKIPLFMAVDQEGGAITRMKYATIMPGNMALGAVGDERLAYRVARTMGNELKALGFNLDFAPVVDVNNNPDNPIIGVRSFGSDPELVSRLGLKFMKGLNDAGIISAMKHFPGHGDTGVDSHIDLPTIVHDMERLESVELKPYYTMIEHQAEMIMTAHITFPAIETVPEIPATLSYQCLTGFLRERMGFQGVIITDALNMKAITKRYGQSEAAGMAVMAGADILLMPREIDITIPYLVNQVRRGNIPLTRIEASVQRILALKLKHGMLRTQPSDALQSFDDNIMKTNLKIVGSRANAGLEQKAAGKAVTLIKNDGQILPYRLTSGKRLVFFTPSSKGLETVESAIHGIFPGVQAGGGWITGFNYENLHSLTAEQKRAVAASDFVILFTRTVSAKDIGAPGSFMAAFAKELVAYTGELDKKIAAVAVRNPYDIRFIPEVKAYLAVYSDWGGGGVEAAFRAMFGKVNPSGKLPVTLLDQNGEILYAAGFGLRYD